MSNKAKKAKTFEPPPSPPPLAPTSGAEPGAGPLYPPGARCYARESNAIYLAQIRKVVPPSETQLGDNNSQDNNNNNNQPTGYQYFVHYQGWNVRWDKWVTERDLLPDNDETKEIANRVKEQNKLNNYNSKKRKNAKGDDPSILDTALGNKSGSKNSNLSESDIIRQKVSGPCTC